MLKVNLTSLSEILPSGCPIKETLERYAVYVFDYGAPVGFRLAVRHPERITAIISQNGNAYVEGLSEAWDPIKRYWQTPSEENRNALRSLLTLETAIPPKRSLARATTSSPPCAIRWSRIMLMLKAYEPMALNRLS